MTCGSAERQVVNVRALIGSLLANFEPRAKSQGVGVEVVVFAEDLTADEALMRRFLIGMLYYALQRAPAGSDLSLAVSPRRGHVQFQVAIDGLPLAYREQSGGFVAEGARLIQRVFGLDSCRLAVEAQGGRVWTKETTTELVVGVELPISAPLVGPLPVRTKSGTQLRAAPWEREKPCQTILIVDDEPLVRTFLLRALKEKGYGVIEADCAERAMDRLMVRRQPLALLVTDVGLPGASGADLARQATLLMPSLPTLLMSATPKCSLVRDGVINRGTDLLPKPFSIAELFSKVDALVARPRTGTRAG